MCVYLCSCMHIMSKKLDGNYTRMLRAILNKSWRQHSTRHQLYGHLPPITKTIQVRRARHAGHCWRSRDELIRDVLLWTPTHGRAKAGRPARTYIQQLCEDTGCCPEDLPRAMNDREEWREISVLPARYDDDADDDILIILFTNPMFLSTNSLSRVNTLSCKYNSISSHIVVCLFITTTRVHYPERNRLIDWF